MAGGGVRERGIGRQRTGRIAVIAVVDGLVLWEQVGILGLLILDRVDDGAVVDDADAAVEDGRGIEPGVVGEGKAGSELQRVFL